MPTAEDIERRLWLAAEGRAAQYYLEIAPDCVGLLRQFIRVGVARIVAENLTDDDLQIDLAEANILAFTTRMIVEARALRLPRLHEPTFIGARSALCPVWPFC